MSVAIRAATWPAAVLAAAAAAGLVAGGLTGYLQGLLPVDWNTVANSGAVWTVVAFAVAALVGRSRATAAGAGTLVLVGEVAGYYAYVSGIRHLPVLHSEELLWTVAALWIGPLAGLAAFYARWGRPGERPSALTAICGVVVGEGSYLVRFAGVPESGWTEIALGTVAAIGVLGATGISSRGRLAALGAGLVVTAAVYLAYSQPLLV